MSQARDDDDGKWCISEDGHMGAMAEKLLQDIVRFHRHTGHTPPHPEAAALLLALSLIHISEPTRLLSIDS